jgi:hypothetical protein
VSFVGLWLVQQRDVSDYSNEAMNRVTQVDFSRPGVLASTLYGRASPRLYRTYNHVKKCSNLRSMKINDLTQWLPDAAQDIQRKHFAGIFFCEFIVSSCVVFVPFKITDDCAKVFPL